MHVVKTPSQVPKSTGSHTNSLIRHHGWLDCWRPWTQTHSCLFKQFTQVKTSICTWMNSLSESCAPVSSLGAVLERWPIEPFSQTHNCYITAWFVWKKKRFYVIINSANTKSTASVLQFVGLLGFLWQTNEQRKGTCMLRDRLTTSFSTLPSQANGGGSQKKRGQPLHPSLYKEVPSGESELL